MRTNSKFIYAGLLLIILAAISSCRKTAVEIHNVPSISISLDKQKATMYVGEQLQLVATVLPQNATDSRVDWFSSNNRIATVDKSGLVTAELPGDVTIKASNTDLSTLCRITVLEKKEPDPGTDPDNPGTDPDNPGTDPDNPGTDPDNPGTDPDNPGIDPTSRWQDTGADVPAYPSYNAVTSLEDFPRIDISTTSSISSKETWVSGTVSFKDPKGMYSTVPELTVPMMIRGRGNSTWNLVDQGVRKNPYRIKLDTKQKVFGMSGDRDWDLLAELMDPTLMRNMVAQRIARLVSMPWSPRLRAVELYINGTYQGCYSLFEHKETGNSKVAITPAVPGISDGGYLLELDEKNTDDLRFYSSTFGKQFNYKDPESPDSEQKTFIEGKINELESALSGQKFSGEGCYRDLIEMDSFIQNFIVQELTMNVDGNMRLSTYWAKDSDTGLFIAFCWDFDLALGNATYLKNDFALDSNGPEGWFIKIRGGSGSDNHGKRDSYYQYMFRDPVFVNRLKELWGLYKPRLDNISSYIDKMQEYNAFAYKHNVDAGKNGRVRSWGVDNETFFDSYSDAIAYMKDYYVRRLNWMNTAIIGL